jgi:microcystin degradation protein MlrC
MTQGVPSQTASAFRIALLGIYHESNTFINSPTTLENFKDSHFLKGEDIIKEYRNSFHEIAGMLEVMESHNVQVIPVMFAEATPGGIVAKEAYELLLQEMLGGLQQQLPVDACLVVPHGAGVAEGYDDMDGHWLTAIRNMVGDIPIVGTLDPHANVSKKMTDATDALISYKTNPHIDQRATGIAAAEILLKYLKKEIRPVQYFVQTPVAISIEQQNTSLHPCSTLLGLAAAVANQKDILSVSLLLGFPYADVEDMGSGFIVVSDNLSVAELVTKGNYLLSALTGLKEDCVGEMKTIASILPMLHKNEAPTLLLDMGDNIGGGSPGDSAYLLNAIENFGTYTCLTCIFDPAAVEIAAGYEAGDSFDLSFGNISAEKDGEPYFTAVKLVMKGDGKFSEKKPRHGGQVNFDMGKIVVLVTARGNTVMLNSLRVPPFSLSQITSFNIHPQEFDIIIAKGVNAPIAAYSVVCPTIIQVNTPGVTQADMTLFTFHKRRHPLFPFEKNTDDSLLD